MESLYSADGKYYEWDAFRKLRGSLHTGKVKSFIDTEIKKGSKFLLADYKSLFYWAFNHKDKESLLPDALYVWERISKKIGHCSKIANKEHEYNMNRTRLRIINQRANVLYSSMPKNHKIYKNTLDVLLDSAVFLHDYSQVAEIFEDALEKGSIYEIESIRKHLSKYRLPSNVKKLDILHGIRKGFDERKEKRLEKKEDKEYTQSEKKTVEPGVCCYAVTQSRDLADIVREPLLEHKREETEIASVARIAETGIR